MIRVCIIEDEDILRKGLIQTFDWAALNCEVVGEASNGKEGLQVISTVKPDIIILDINMPIMDGLAMIENLPNNMYSFIIVSGHSEFEYAKRAIAYDVSDYLLKPLDHHLLYEALQRAIEDLEMRRIFLSHEKVDEDPFQVLDLPIRVDSMSLSIILDYISEHYSEKITLDDLKEVSLKSSTSINNRFQDYLKMTFNDYLTRYRMQKALEKIQDLDYHLYQVSELVGYQDYKYFSQVFKRVVGVSPKIVETYYLRKRV